MSAAEIFLKFLWRAGHTLYELLKFALPVVARLLSLEVYISHMGLCLT